MESSGTPDQDLSLSEFRGRPVIIAFIRPIGARYAAIK
jgi:hypothetical protein